MSTKPFFKGTSVPEPDYMATALSLSQSLCAQWKIEITLDFCQWHHTACTSQTSTHQVGNIFGHSSFSRGRRQPHIQIANLFACQGYQRTQQARGCQQANPWLTPFEISCCPPKANISEQNGAAQIPRSQVFSWYGTAQPNTTGCHHSPSHFSSCFEHNETVKFTSRAVPMPCELAIHWVNERNLHLKAYCSRLPASSGGCGRSSYTLSKSFLNNYKCWKVSLRTAGHRKQSIIAVSARPQTSASPFQGTPPHWFRSCL